MCTNIAATAAITGSAKTPSGWLKVDEATVSFDHATHAWLDHALRLDFFSAEGPEIGAVALELDLASGRALVERLEQVIAAAERSGVEG